jgi:hypothetical protein
MPVMEYPSKAMTTLGRELTLKDLVVGEVRWPCL